MRVYLDNCCFNRPFDDQSQIRIRLETEAKLKIQDDVFNKKIELAWSYVLEAENAANPFEERKRAISYWKNLAAVKITATQVVLKKAIKLQ